MRIAAHRPASSGFAVSLLANVVHHVSTCTVPRPPRADPGASRRPGVPLPDLGHHRHPAAPVGGRAPQAPRVHRRRGRPALPRAARLVERCRCATSRCTGRGAQPRDARALRQGPPADRLDRVLSTTTPSSASASASTILVPAARPGRRAARRVRPRQPATSAVDAAVNADRPPLRPAAVPQRRRQPAVARRSYRRRRPAQQPPRRAHVGPAVAPLVRDRPGLVGDQDPVRLRAGQGPPRANCGSRTHAASAATKAARAATTAKLAASNAAHAASTKAHAAADAVTDAAHAAADKATAAVDAATSPVTKAGLQA